MSTRALVVRPERASLHGERRGPSIRRLSRSRPTSNHSIDLRFVISSYLGRFKSDLDFGQFNRLVRVQWLFKTLGRPRPTPYQPISTTNGIINAGRDERERVEEPRRELRRDEEVRRGTYPKLTDGSDLRFVLCNSVRFKSDSDNREFQRTRDGHLTFQNTLARNLAQTPVPTTLKHQT